MRHAFHVNDIPPTERASFWRNSASKIFGDHQIIIENAKKFHASVATAALADLQILQVDISPVVLVRTAKDIAHSNNENVFIVVALLGSIRLQQDGRECRSAKRDLLLFSAQRPFTLTITEPVSLLLLRVPARSMERRTGPTIALTASPVRRSDKLAHLATGFLDLVRDALPFASRAGEAKIAGLVLDLSAYALSTAAAKAQRTMSSPRETALASLRMAIDRNLSDPNLSPAMIAADAGISVRYANQLLAEQGTSIVRFVQLRRIEMCCQVLADPTQAHRAITEIALSWGFSDLSHFGRRFREIVGVPPREYRALASRDLARRSGGIKR